MIEGLEFFLGADRMTIQLRCRKQNQGRTQVGQVSSLKIELKKCLFWSWRGGPGMAQLRRICA